MAKTKSKNEFKLTPFTGYDSDSISDSKLNSIISKNKDLITRDAQYGAALKTIKFTKNEGKLKFYASMPLHLTEARLDHANYFESMHVSGLAKAESNNNPMLWVHELSKTLNKITQRLGKDIYTSSKLSNNNDEVSLTGFDEAIGDDQNVYAGIDRSKSENEFWRPTVINKDGPKKEITISQIRKDLMTIRNKAGMQGLVAYVHPNIFNKILSLYDPQKPENFPHRQSYLLDLKSEGGDRASVLMHENVDVFMFQLSTDLTADATCFFIKDEFAPEDAIYYVNRTYTSLTSLDKTVLPFGIDTSVLAKTGDSDKAMMRTYLQLVVHRPNSCGVRYNIA